MLLLTLCLSSPLLLLPKDIFCSAPPLVQEGRGGSFPSLPLRLKLSSVGCCKAELPPQLLEEEEESVLTLFFLAFVFFSLLQ
jgi:hypothetical protein